MIMNSKVKNQLRERLKNKLIELKSEITWQRENLEFYPRSGIEEQIDQKPLLETAAFLIDYESGLIHEVQSALSHLEEESFGTCRSCGRKIELRRLHAVPWSRYCIDCQEKKENQANVVQFHGGNYFTSEEYSSF
jgi:DnaK suppressor protein